jgi:hypothetical protein
MPEQFSVGRAEHCVLRDAAMAMQVGKHVTTAHRAAVMDRFYPEEC